jgi:hypothetical protein
MKVGYTRYDVAWFIKQMDFTKERFKTTETFSAAVTLYIHVVEVLDSNTDNYDSSSWFSSVAHGTCGDNTSIRPRPLPHAKFRIHLSLYH